MNEILAARRALKDPLIRFRSAVATFSSEISVLPGDNGFDREVAVLYRRDVAPALQELKEIQNDLRLDRELERHGLESAKEVVAGAVALAALHSVDANAVASAVIAAAPAVARIGSGLLEDHRTADQERRRNRFLFLYEAGRRLKS